MLHAKQYSVIQPALHTAQLACRVLMYGVQNKTKKVPLSPLGQRETGISLSPSNSRFLFCSPLVFSLMQYKKYSTPSMVSSPEIQVTDK
jgi:hypothetical protein